MQAFELGNSKCMSHEGFFHIKHVPISGICVVDSALQSREVKDKDMNCQDISQSAQHRDKSHTTHQTLWSRLEHMSFVQGPVEVSCSGWEKGVKRTS